MGRGSMQTSASIDFSFGANQQQGRRVSEANKPGEIHHPADSVAINMCFPPIRWVSPVV